MFDVVLFLLSTGLWRYLMFRTLCTTRKIQKSKKQLQKAIIPISVYNEEELVVFVFVQFFGTRTEEEMLPTSAFANSKDEWSSKWSERTHRTNLWTLGIQTGPSSLDKDDNENLDHDIISANGYKFHIYPSPRLSLQSDTIMTLPAFKPPTPSSASVRIHLFLFFK